MEEQNAKSVETAYKVIVDQINNLTLRPGEVVTENSLAERFGLGRTPVREALKRLETQGLIETNNRTKTIYSLKVRDIEEIFELKIALESMTARHAALRGEDAQMDDLRDLIIDMNRLLPSADQPVQAPAEVLMQWLALDIKFHQLLFQMAGNHRAEKTIANLNIQWHRLKVGINAIEERITKAIGEHQAIGYAVLERDGERAAWSMSTHLANLKDLIIRLMKAFSYNE